MTFGNFIQYCRKLTTLPRWETWNLKCCENLPQVENQNAQALLSHSLSRVFWDMETFCGTSDVNRDTAVTLTELKEDVLCIYVYIGPTWNIIFKRTFVVCSCSVFVCLLFLRQTNIFIRFIPAPSFSTSDSLTWLNLFSGGGLNNKIGNLQKKAPKSSPKGSRFKAHVYKNLSKNFWGYFCVTFRQPDWNQLQSLQSQTIFECNTHSLRLYDAHTVCPKRTLINIVA